jgi:hypothetical protein
MTTWRKFFTRTAKLWLIAAAALVFFILWRQANNPLWRGHLEIDTWNYWLKVEDILKHRTFTTKIGNEILPATTLFLMLPSWINQGQPLNYSVYLNNFFWLIFLILLINLYLIVKTGSAKKGIIFLTLTLFFGPIILFRFDALAALLVVGGLVAFKKKLSLVSAALLGLAVSCKVYPVIFLPYLGLILWFNQRRIVFKWLAVFTLALVLPIGLFFYSGGRIIQLTSGLSFHANKYVSIESIAGSLMTLWSVISKHHPPQLLGGWGIWGIPSRLDFFNWFWLIPLSLFYLCLFNRKRFFQNLNYGVIFCLMLLFLVFAKNLHAQYLWWFVPIFTLLEFNLFATILIIFICIFSQIVYPLNYTLFIEDFYLHNQAYAVFYGLLVRNLLMALLTVYSLRKTLCGR